jgi:hypothetical protein
MSAPVEFGYPSCKGGVVPDAIIQQLSKKYPTRPGKNQWSNKF